MLLFCFWDWGLRCTGGRADETKEKVPPMTAPGANDRGCGPRGPQTNAENARARMLRGPVCEWALIRGRGGARVCGGAALRLWCRGASFRLPAPRHPSSRHVTHRAPPSRRGRRGSGPFCRVVVFFVWRGSFACLADVRQRRLLLLVDARRPTPPNPVSRREAPPSPHRRVSVAAILTQIATPAPLTSSPRLGLRPW